MVLIVHLDKSILFLEYKNILISFFFFFKKENILISITSLQQKISMKKNNYNRAIITPIYYGR